jgi:hypothetical protein
MNIINFSKSKEMIWTLRIKRPKTISECVRVIEIKSNATLLELHEAIQEAVNFDNDHLFDFFMARSPDSRGYSVGLDPNSDSFNPVKTYRDIRLSSLWPLPASMQLYYLFDFGDNWLFQINKTRHKDKTPQPDIIYPRVIEKRGDNPEQYPDWDE